MRPTGSEDGGQRGSRSGAEARGTLIAATHRLLGTAGLEATSIAAVAQAAGVAKATVLYHFGSRDALILATVEAILGPSWAQQEQAARRPGDPRQALDAWLQVCFAVEIETVRLRAQIASSATGSPALRRLADAERGVEIAIAALLERGHRMRCWRAPRPDQAAVLAIAIVDGCLASGLRSGDSTTLPVLQAMCRSALLDVLVRS